MQLSIKPPPELTVPILEKCAVIGEAFHSVFAHNCVAYCLDWMEIPRDEYRSFTSSIIGKYYYALGREDELLPSIKEEKEPSLAQRLAKQYQEERAKGANERLQKLRSQFEKQPPPKHLHLKISKGLGDMPTLIKEKCAWLRLTPNAFVVACLRDCLAAMDDVQKALIAPPIAVDFWTLSHVREQRKAKDGMEAFVMHSIRSMLLNRSGPILDTIVRHAINEQWDTSLKKILIEADALTETGGFKP